MMLYVNGQEIASLGIGLIDQALWRTEPVILPVRPEGYLAAIESWLKAQQLAPAQLTGIVLVQGPGSATALRTSHALVNALAFTWAIPVVSVEKPLSETDVEILPKLASVAGRPFALPSYTNSPNITASKRDALKRKTS